MYLGSLDVFHSNNIEKYPLAAHGFRELMITMAEVLNVEQPEHGRSLGVEVSNLQSRWQAMTNKSDCYRNDSWSGEIDAPFQTFLNKLSRFFEWWEEHRPKRKSEAAKMLDAMDPARAQSPAPLQDLNIEYWSKIRDFFTKLAHHGPEPKEREFEQYAAALERFLIDRLIPRTFDDLNDIDRLLARSKSDD
jgi:hypothetical protein